MHIRVHKFKRKKKQKGKERIMLLLTKYKDNQESEESGRAVLEKAKAE
jgi:hypothetical protein